MIHHDLVMLVHVYLTVHTSFETNASPAIGFIRT